jgi:hypothetical protein
MERQELECHIPVEFGVVGFVDHPHTTFAEFFEDFVMGDSFTNHLKCF